MLYKYSITIIYYIKLGSTWVQNLRVLQDLGESKQRLLFSITWPKTTNDPDIAGQSY